MTFATVGVGGFSSNAGKTTLMCELLRGVPGWEAVKITRGHYRSCGKDPHACCVSHLLGDEPVLRSGRAETYAPGKDTGRYWDAGAANVHWLIVTDRQVERGIKAALARVKSPGVLIEGTSFVQFVAVDLMLLAARADGGADKLKPSARRALAKTDALYLFEEGDASPARNGALFAEHEVFDEGGAAQVRARVAEWRATHVFAGSVETVLRGLPVYTRADLPRLVERVRGLETGRGLPQTGGIVVA